MTMKKHGKYEEVNRISTEVKYKLKGRKRVLDRVFGFDRLDEVPHFVRLLKSSPLVTEVLVQHWVTRSTHEWTEKERFVRRRVRSKGGPR